MRRLALTTTFALLALLALAAPGWAASSNFTIRGAGFGHGIGLSQWGAFGYAQHGSGWRDIVLHYFKDTRIANAGDRTVRVLLQSGKTTVWFEGATRAAGKKLDPGARYRATQKGINQVELRSARGKILATVDAPLSVSSSSGSFLLEGTALNGLSGGRYRGVLEVRPGLFGGLAAVDALPLDDYIKGVVVGEVPTSWPMAALQAQAVVARSYSLTTDAGGAVFDQYPDTRSQMYYGMSRETPRTNDAVTSTNNQVVKYGDRVAVTYYFSSSGGRTENIENAFVGSSPVPYLKSVDDPYDTASPRHRWRFVMSRSQLDRKLGSWVRGKLRSVKVTQRGISPRIVKARIVGSRGSTTVTGPQLRTRLGLFDTWAYFITIKSGQQRETSGDAPPDSGQVTDGGGTQAAAAVAINWLKKLFTPRRLIVAGSVSPRPKHITLEHKTRKGWKTVGRGKTDGHGRYALLVRSRGVYRVLANGAVGPETRIR